MALRLR
ncbi:UNVERIFIED_CONTAM: hypothetical protein GTU68_052446 [Idotea baltica]|nr:hypothetical protein [Idotea baltica]